MPLLGLISDVHGDPDALRLACEHLAALGAESIVCAGDLVGYGPSPDRAVAELAERAIPSVRGNHDRWALERPPGEPDEFGGGTPGPETLLALRRLEPSLVFERAGRLVVVVHGAPRSDMEFITPSLHPRRILDGYLATLGVDVLVHGHTHRPMWYRSDRGLVVNPGSIVSASRVESSRTFALLDLAALSATFHEVATGRPVAVPPWPEAEGPPPRPRRIP